ncbi:MAG: DUF3426 domain-containing protein, partial [Pseudomonadota bacterium]|nr:DUF3426 domain-containing protein [Pseudomonadota bacterium]
MSLATRCTACGTAFRVVQDQLKVSEGWVRCGRCSVVFNALEGLFDLDRESAVDWKEPPGGDMSTEPDSTASDPKTSDPTAAEPVRPSDPVALAASFSTAAFDEAGHAAPTDGTAQPDALVNLDLKRPSRPVASEPENGGDDGAENVDANAASLDKQIDAHLFGSRRASRHRAAAVDVDQRDRLDFSDARFDSDLPADDDISETVDKVPHADRLVELPLESAVAPEFVRRAESRARWQRPRVRASLAVAATLLLLALTLQAGHHFRDIVAARWPALRTALADWCTLAGCALEAPHRIDDIGVESTALTRAPGVDAFKLAVTLRSRSSVPVAAPWIDLTLTDTAGKLVARKALAAREFNPGPTVIEPGAEVTWQALL